MREGWCMVYLSFMSVHIVQPAPHQFKLFVQRDPFVEWYRADKALAWGDAWTEAASDVSTSSFIINNFTNSGGEE